MNYPTGNRTRGVAERIEADLAHGFEVTAEGVARRTGCGYFTASRYLYARYVARAVDRRKACMGTEGRPVWMYSRRNHEARN